MLSSPVSSRLPVRFSRVRTNVVSLCPLLRVATAVQVPALLHQRRGEGPHGGLEGRKMRESGA